MASAISHAVAALSIGTLFLPTTNTQAGLGRGMVRSVLPDLDVMGFRFGIRYGDSWGHREFRSEQEVQCTAIWVTYPAKPETSSFAFQSRAICVAYTTFATG